MYTCILYIVYMYIVYMYIVYMYIVYMYIVYILYCIHVYCVSHAILLLRLLVRAYSPSALGACNQHIFHRNKIYGFSEFVSIHGAKKKSSSALCIITVYCTLIHKKIAGVHIKYCFKYYTLEQCF